MPDRPSKNAERGAAPNTRERILSFVKERILAGFPPTVREVQQAFRFKSSASAREHLDRLVTDGHLTRQEGISRGFQLPTAAAAGKHKAERALRIPIMGRVQAGAWNLAVEDIEGYIWAPERYVPKRGKVASNVRQDATESERLFALRVHGESMIDKGILPGDIVVVHRQPTAESGQIVVALVDDDATVKIFRRNGRRIELHPANPAFKVLRPDPEHLVILGRVVEIRREIG